MSAPLNIEVEANQPSRKEVSPLTRDFLAWIAGGPRSYAEAMEGWRTSCPRFPIWEDAVSDGLIHLESAPGDTLRGVTVVLTDRGRAILNNT
jgi:hypothetical protein